MPLHEREAYLGKPKKIEGKLVFSLSKHLKDNLSDICDLVTEVFDACACYVVAEYQSEAINLLEAQSESGTLFASAFEALHTHNFTGYPNVELDAQLHIIVPIVLEHDLKFGALIFTRKKPKALTRRESRILGVIARDIRNFFIQRKESALIEESSELQLLISQINHDWIFVKDEEFKIVYANDAFLQVYPKDMRDKVIGYTTIEEYNEEESEKFLKNDKIAFEVGLSEAIEDLHMPDGSHLIVATTKRRFEDKSGKPYILCVCRDITEKENLIRDLQKANQELDDFTSIASHDLKAPLNAIRRLLAWIEEESADVLSDNAKENLDFVLSRAERMHALLNDLLTFAKIGKETPKLEQISLKKVVSEMQLLVDLPAQAKIRCEELLMTVPSVPFSTVLLNLISNAIKHNDKDAPTIDISGVVSRHYYVVKVKDNGPGIPKQYQERVFKLFQTLRPRDEVEGSGMGLSVVRKYLEAYRGRVELYSDGETGCEFTIYWPLSPQV